MRQITDHHDGHGLNESITIEADDLGPGGASHKYEMRMKGYSVGALQFQEGPRNVDGSIDGLTEAALVAVLIDRLRGFQAGPYACRENAIQLTKLEEVLHWTRARADARAKRGVLGTYAK
jgi:hypothetical protein